MTLKERRIFSIFCVALLILAAVILLNDYRRINARMTKIISSTSASQDTDPTGYTHTTTASQLNRTESGENTTVRRTFSHEIYTPEGDAWGTMTVTVTGSISNDGCIISHMSTAMSEEPQTEITFSEHVSGETATVVLYRNQISVCHFQYRVSPEGSIDYL